ncbi:transposase [Atopobium sp. oral taxon 416]|uniref:transposase n=1 Tax=Atopobium sp. oral taxon 416 TaxID=712157 RepID=UPI001BAD09E7|nr:transposase [Atopobium sp. oral taxon 416]QUC03851.1 transposase [Atopobium sp. oral taxon 416]
MDPFHVVQGITDTLDEVRCKEWQVAKKAADAIKGSRFALVQGLGAKKRTCGPCSGQGRPSLA